MHKRSVTASIEFVEAHIDEQKAISDAIHGINGVAQWKIEELQNGAYTIQVWLANGLDHVNAEKAIRDVFSESDRIKSYTIQS